MNFTWVVTYNYIQLHTDYHGITFMITNILHTTLHGITLSFTLFNTYSLPIYYNCITSDFAWSVTKRNSLSITCCYSIILLFLLVNYTSNYILGYMHITWLITWQRMSCYMKLHLVVKLVITCSLHIPLNCVLLASLQNDFHNITCQITCHTCTCGGASSQLCWQLVAAWVWGRSSLPLPGLPESLDKQLAGFNAGAMQRTRAGGVPCWFPSSAPLREFRRLGWGAAVAHDGEFLPAMLAWQMLLAGVLTMPAWQVLFLQPAPALLVTLASQVSFSLLQVRLCWLHHFLWSHCVPEIAYSQRSINDVAIFKQISPLFGKDI